MQALKTRINPRSDEFRTNADTTRKLVEELRARLCHEAGGYEGGHRCRRALMLIILILCRISSLTPS